MLKSFGWDDKVMILAQVIIVKVATLIDLSMYLTILDIIHRIRCELFRRYHGQAAKRNRNA